MAGVKSGRKTGGRNMSASSAAGLGRQRRTINAQGGLTNARNNSRAQRRRSAKRAANRPRPAGR